MLFYFILVTLCFCSFLFKQLKHSQNWFYFVVSIVGIFLCFGYMTGSDWRQYEVMYEELGKSLTQWTDSRTEIGYWYYMWIFKILHIDFWVFFIFTKCWLYGTIIYFLKKYGDSVFYLALTFFVATFGFAFFIDNPMRNLIAAVIFLFTFKYLIEKKILKYILVVLLATSFHISAIFFLFLYFFFQKRWSTTFWIITYILINILFLGAKDFFLQFIAEHFSNNLLLGKAVTNYIIGETNIDGQFFSLGMLTKVLFFILLLNYRKKLENLPYGKLIFNFALTFLCIYRIALSIEIFIRFQMYLSVFFSIAVALLFYGFKSKSKIIYSSYLFLIILYSTYTLITGSYKFIPYTNYLTYIWQIKPDYSYRSDYNLIRSPYTSD